MVDLSMTREAEEGDRVELVLLKARELIESTVSEHRNAPVSRSLFEIRPDGKAVANAVARLIGQAKHSVSLAVPGECDLQAKAVNSALTSLSTAGRRGVTVRLLCSTRMLGTPLVRTASRPGSGCEVRIVAGDLQEALISDGRIALVRSGAERTGRHAAIVEDPASVRALDLLFASTWGSAVPVAEGHALGKRLRMDSARSVLEWLCSGQTDEVAARELQVSLRTYRRHVAEIMRALGANSRFQAGARAVELGLLDRD